MHQPYCEKDRRFLADRYVLGTCPHCGYADARGDQCENCGKLLDPTELIDPRCSVCSSRPVIKETKHLFIDLMAILPKLRNWIESAAEKGFWARNAVQMTYAWMRDGLKERAITRDLNWGIPVPWTGIGTRCSTSGSTRPSAISPSRRTSRRNWKSWWYAPKAVKLFQFIGKDNIPFHTVIFPQQPARHRRGLDHAVPHVLHGVPQLRGRKVLQEQGRGRVRDGRKGYGHPRRRVAVLYLLQPAREVGRPVHVEGLPGEGQRGADRQPGKPGQPHAPVREPLLPGALPASEPGRRFWQEVRAAEAEITGLLEKVELRDAFRRIFALSSFGNKRFQDGEPWKGVKENPEATARLIWNLTYLVRDLAILIRPYLPATSERIGKVLGLAPTSWKDLGAPKGIETVQKPDLLFAKLEDKEVESLRLRFSGTQKERAQAADAAASAAASAPPPAPAAPPLSPAEISAGFRGQVDLRVARIVEVKRHPKAEKLYIETVDLGTEQRTIVSGLVPYYKEEELLGHNVVLVANLKPAVLRGVESNGMLLAASNGDTVEVLFLDEARPGDRVAPTGPASEPTPVQIDIDRFLSLPITVEDSRVMAGDAALECGGRPIVTARVAKGRVK